ncbi:hypothetical protein [Helicobacter pylori]|uniref:hypothetical protein n=1 Tax=Helicobacter pylori TaxID=210 RepID=UPI001F0C956E|nr:hypothetical protein [Helicobacter pylori]
MKKDRKKKQKYSNITDATILGSTSEESALYASANREHLSVLDKLEEISKRKINPNYTNQNINQQAGYSAEIKEQAHVNANNILAGKMGRLRQYDDLSSTQKAQIGERFPDYATPSKNHEIVDYISVDKKGNVIPGTLTQSKFVGRNGAECFEKFLSKPYKKYFENSVKMNVPKDYYRGIQKTADAKIESLESQIAKQKGLGDFQKVAHLEEKRQYCKTIKAHTRPARVAKGEAIEARLNPNLSTAKDVASVSHQAGMNAAQTGALIGGGVSAITNIYECIANGKDPVKAIKHTTIATLKGGALSYGSAFASSSLGGWMQSSANKIIQSLGKGSLPAMFVGACVANATILGRYLSGKIDGKELLKQLGKANTTLVSSGAMAVAGQALIPMFDVLFFSLAQDAIATMKKHNYNVSRYNQKEKDQLCVTVSTLSSLSAFLKVSIMDKHQKLNEKAKNALNLMRDQTDSLENGNYSLRGIRFRQARLEDLRDDKTS